MVRRTPGTTHSGAGKPHRHDALWFPLVLPILANGIAKDAYTIGAVVTGASFAARRFRRIGARARKEKTLKPARTISRLALAYAAALALPALAELPVERVGVATVPAANPYRLYLSDMVISHFIDARLIIVDGESLKVLGNVGTALTGHSTLSPDRSEILVSTAYFTKLNRGERIGELDIYDATTLKLKAEIPVPPKHAQSMPYRGSIRTSADGHFVYMQNATPATSVTVVDRTAGKFVAEIPTPGCWMIYPPQSSSNRFSTLCGDGTMLTITLDAEGKPLDKKKSAKFFDPDADALFVAGEQMGDDYLFVSFKGNIQAVNVGGDVAVADKPWTLLTAADQKAGWRPGGYQPMALQQKSSRLYVGMHPKGREGSHKDPAKEIWAFDLATKKRVARVPGLHSTVLAASRGDAPKLYAMSTEKQTIAVFDAGSKLKHLTTAGPYGEYVTQVDTQ
jgi:methylamine dehydrogenase heavy chain